jgi:hypothetical protein
MNISVTAGRRSSGRRRRRSRRRLVVLLVALAVVVLLLGWAAWVAVRAVMARGELEAAVPLVQTIEKQISTGDSAGAQATYPKLVAAVSSAQSLTSDPLWRSAEVLPGVGPNLSAVREVAASIDRVTTGAIGPATRLAGSVTPSSFAPVGGAIRLQPLVDAAPVVTAANTNMQEALREVDGIDTAGTIGPVRDAVTRLRSTVRTTAQLSDTVARAARLLPSMLGQQGPRTYLVLLQNNAELRSTGGISGALALVRVDDGAISLVQQASSSDFPQAAQPVVPLAKSTTNLYGPLVGEYIQDVNLTPQFPLAARAAQAMWAARYGTEPDGVIALDPITLGYMLRATGAVGLPGGVSLTSANAVQELLSTVYARLPDPGAQDAFFAAAAAAVFGKVAQGGWDPRAMIAALAQAGDEHRILVWSDRPAEESQLAGTTLAGGLPSSEAGGKTFGVYLNDATGAKMDYYLRGAVSVGMSSCPAHGGADYLVEVTLKNTAPADAATSLPRYVTGTGTYGTPPGAISTIVGVYAPPGLRFVSAKRGSAAEPSLPASNAGRSLDQFEVELAPGQSTTIALIFRGTEPFSGPLAVAATPTIYGLETKAVARRCESALQ